jgi:YfiR/HmsC-like
MASALTGPVARGGPRRLLTVSVLALWVVTVGMDQLAGQAPATRQEDIEATFIYNFGKFVDWPESSFSESVRSFRIEIVGRDPFDGRLDQVMIGKTMHDLPIEVVHSLGQASTTPVHIAFVSGSEKKRLDVLLSTYRGQHVLTVSNIGDFTQNGGMIGFVTEAGAVRFTIDQATVMRSDLRMSSRLLALGVPQPTVSR